MIKKRIICDACGKSIAEYDTVYELTDELGVTAQMCWCCKVGLEDSKLICDKDTITEKLVKEVLADAE